MRRRETRLVSPRRLIALARRGGGGGGGSDRSPYYIEPRHGLLVAANAQLKDAPVWTALAGNDDPPTPSPSPALCSSRQIDINVIISGAGPAVGKSARPARAPSIAICGRATVA